MLSITHVQTRTQPLGDWRVPYTPSRKLAEVSMILEIKAGKMVRPLMPPSILGYKEGISVINSDSDCDCIEKTSNYFSVSFHCCCVIQDSIFWQDISHQRTVLAHWPDWHRHNSVALKGNINTVISDHSECLCRCCRFGAVELRQRWLFGSWESTGPVTGARWLYLGVMVTCRFKVWEPKITMRWSPQSCALIPCLDSPDVSMG